MNAFFSVQFSIVNESMFVVLESVVIVAILFGITTESQIEAVLRVWNLEFIVCQKLFALVVGFRLGCHMFTGNYSCCNL